VLFLKHEKFKNFQLFLYVLQPGKEPGAFKLIHKNILKTDLPVRREVLVSSNGSLKISKGGMKNMSGKKIDNENNENEEENRKKKQEEQEEKENLWKSHRTNKESWQYAYFC